MNEVIHPSVQHITPDRVLDIAYCFHVYAFWLSQNRPGDLPPDVLLAKKIVDNFERMQDDFPNFSKEKIYLDKIGQIIVSLSRGLSRGKNTLEEKLKQAGRKRDKQLEDINRSVLPSGTFRSGWKILGPVVIGLLGFALTKSVVPGIESAQKLEPNYFSLATGLGFALISSALSSWYQNFNIMKIYALHDHAWFGAMEEYDLSQLQEYKRAEHFAKIAWHELTGQKAEEWPGFDDWIDKQRDLRNRAREEAMRLAANPVYQIFLLFSQWRKKR